MHESVQDEEQGRAEKRVSKGGVFDESIHSVKKLHSLYVVFEPGHIILSKLNVLFTTRHCLEMIVYCNWQDIKNQL